MADRPFVTKKTMLAALDGEALRQVARMLGVDVPEGADAEAARAALAGSRAATARRLLSVLDGDMGAEVIARVGFEPTREGTPAGRRPVPPESRFVAIDFETADAGADSACAVALVRVHGTDIVDRAYRLIRPPRRNVVNAWVHGLTWPDLSDAPPFADVWPEMTPMLEGAHFMVAHNASFDRRVMRACCSKAGLPIPALRFKCTVKWSRRTFDLPRVNLKAVSEHLEIALNHHQALSDAEACARIMIEVQRRWADRIGG